MTHDGGAVGYRAFKCVLLTATLLGTLVPVAAEQEVPGWVKIRDDVVLWMEPGDQLPDSLAAPGDGYYLFDNAAGLDALHTIRLVASEGIETVRPRLEAAASEILNATGLVLVVAGGTIAPGTAVAPGEIHVKVSDDAPCGPGHAGCAGVYGHGVNELSDVPIISAGRAWIYSVALGYSTRNLQHVVSHELGHTLGLDHFSGAYFGGFQVMHPSSYDAESFRDGDFNGLRHQMHNARIDFIGFGNGTRIDLFDGDATGRYELSGSYAPFAGDFNGDGNDDVFLYGPGGEYDAVLWSNGDGSFTQTISVDGISGSYKPVVADYDGNGSDDIFWHTTDGDYDHIWWGGPARQTSGWTANDQSPFGLQGAYNPIAGDFDGDGYADLFLYGPGNETDEIRWGPLGDSLAARTIGSLPEPIPSIMPRRTTYDIWGTYEPSVGDFDGDGFDDIYWYQRHGQDDHIWWSRPMVRHLSFTSNPLPNSGTYRVVAGDFDGDLRSDLLLSDPEKDDGEAIVFGSLNRVLSSRALRTTRGIPFYLFAGDFDGDGPEDVYGYRPGL